MNGVANPLLDKEEHPLQLGESFERHPKASFHTIRCECPAEAALVGQADDSEAPAWFSRSGLVSKGGPPSALALAGLTGNRVHRVQGGLLPRAEGSSKIQARIEQQSARAAQSSTQFRAPTKPAAGPKTSPLKDNPSPEPQLDDIKRELRAEVEIIEQMSSSSGSSSSDSESSSGSGDETSSSDGGETANPSPSQQCNNKNVVANGTGRAQGNNQLMNTLRNDLQLSESGSDSDD